MIEKVQLMSGEECSEALRTLYDLRGSWIERAPHRPGLFFTLGRASYLDVCLPEADPEESYYNRVERENEQLLSSFPWLYQRLISALTELLATPVELARGLAVPGFHLFFGRGINSAGNCRSHFDVQYDKLRLPGPLDDSEPISFTLAIRLPHNGSGLETWNVTARDYGRAFARGVATTADDYAARKVRAYHPYTEGGLVVHRGLVLHRLNSPGPILEEDLRATLQGHGLRIDGRWLLYW